MKLIVPLLFLHCNFLHQRFWQLFLAPLHYIENGPCSPGSSVAFGGPSLFKANWLVVRWVNLAQGTAVSLSKLHILFQSSAWLLLIISSACFFGWLLRLYGEVIAMKEIECPFGFWLCNWDFRSSLWGHTDKRVLDPLLILVGHKRLTVFLLLDLFIIFELVVPMAIRAG
jgi:hypothetical protein